MGYGWALQSSHYCGSPNLAVSAIITILNAYPDSATRHDADQGSSITACVRPPFITTASHEIFKSPIIFFQNNIVRCLLGAGMPVVFIVSPILGALDDGWTCVVLGGLAFAYIGPSSAVRRDPVGTLLATATGKRAPVVDCCRRLRREGIRRDLFQTTVSPRPSLTCLSIAIHLPEIRSQLHILIVGPRTETLWRQTRITHSLGLFLQNRTRSS